MAYEWDLFTLISVGLFATAVIIDIATLVRVNHCLYTAAGLVWFVGNGVSSMMVMMGAERMVEYH